MYVMVNKEQISSTLKTCDESILLLKEERKKLSTLIGNIGEVWKGKDADAFALKMSYFVDDKFVAGYVDTEKKLDSHYRTREIKVE